MPVVLLHDRTSPCEECPFTKAGRIPNGREHMVAKTLAGLRGHEPFSCHMTYSFFDEAGEFVQRQTPQPRQRCAGHMLYAQVLDRTEHMSVEDKRHLLRLTGESFKSPEEMIAHYPIIKIAKG